MTTQTYTTSSEQETRALARTFAAQLKRGSVVGLTGDLGAGKTQFVQGVCEAFGVVEHVMSPSFVILNRYSGKDANELELLVYHLDLYRVKSVEELYDIGLEEFLYGDGLTLIEWAEQLGGLLPAERFDVRFSFGVHAHERRIEIERRRSSKGHVAARLKIGI
jgi:tRNA threonylcarbamoyladenosine biosynthesis protein TsaE